MNGRNWLWLEHAHLWIKPFHNVTWPSDDPDISMPVPAVSAVTVCGAGRTWEHGADSRTSDSFPTYMLITALIIITLSQA